MEVLLGLTYLCRRSKQILYSLAKENLFVYFLKIRSRVRLFGSKLPLKVEYKIDIMKVRTYVLIVSVAFLFMSSGTKNAKPSTGFNPGDLAPGIESLTNMQSLSYRNDAGRYTLVNFWAAYDAESRVKNIRLSNEVIKSGSDKIVLYSFSLDEKPSVFTETIKTDRLNESTQFHVEQGKNSLLYKEFNRKGGFQNYLINSEGVIVAKNVTPDKLQKILKES